MRGWTINRFFKNTYWLILGSVIRMVIGFAAGVLTARYLGPADYGLLNYVMAYVAFFVSLCGLGLGGVIIHQWVCYPGGEGDILGTAMFLRFIAGLLSVGALLGLLFLVEGGDETIMAIGLLLSLQLPFLCMDTVHYWYQWKLLAKVDVAIMTVGQVFLSALKIGLLAVRADVRWFALATSLNAVFIGLLYLGGYRRRGSARLCVSGACAKRMLGQSAPFILANMMVFIYGKMDTLMIKGLMGSVEQVGLYQVALTLCGLIGFIPTAILDSARPALMALKEANEARYQLRTRQVFGVLIWLCAAYALCITLLGNVLLRLLYGEAYMGAAGALRIAVWYTVFSYLGGAKSVWLICEGKNALVLVFSALGAGSNVALNLLLIPRLGISGAAVATLITQVLTNLIYPAFFPQMRGYVAAVKDALLFRNLDLRGAWRELKAGRG